MKNIFLIFIMLTGLFFTVKSDPVINSSIDSSINKVKNAFAPVAPNLPGLRNGPQSVIEPAGTELVSVSEEIFETLASLFAILSIFIFSMVISYGISWIFKKCYTIVSRRNSVKNNPALDGTINGEKHLFSI